MRDRKKWGKKCPVVAVDPYRMDRAKASTVLAMRMMGKTWQECAAEVNLSPQGTRNLMQRAGRRGWLNLLEDGTTDDIIELEVKPRIVRNLVIKLDEEQDKENGSEVTLAGAKLYTAPKESAQPTPMALQINFGNVPATPVQVQSGTVGGAPAFIDGDAE